MTLALRRRTLLKLALGALAAPAVAAARPPRPVMSLGIAGTAYHGLASVALRAGDVLTLRREADNRFDTNAVAIHAACGTRLGYVPRRGAGEVAALLDAGREVRAEVTRFLPVPAKGERLVIPEGLVRTWVEPGEPVVALLT